MCEECGLKSAGFGMASDRKRLWCGPCGKPKGATAHNLGDAPGGGGRVDMSLVQRMEQERARAGSEAQGVRVMRYEGSQSESVLSNAMARATLGAASGAPTFLPPDRASPAAPGSIPDR